MARKKVKLAWIANDSARRATLKKRRKGLMKKVSELSVLCDVRACAVVYGPQEAQPEVWPSAAGAMRVLAKFRSMPEMEQSKKMMNQEGFLRQRNAKIQDQLRRHERENREVEAALMLYRALGGHGLHAASIEDVACLAWLVEMKAKAVHERLEAARRSMTATDDGKMMMMVKPPSLPVVASASASAAAEKSPLEAAMEELQRQEWFMEVMNPHEQQQLLFGAEEMMQQPFVDHNNPLLDAYFPLN